MLLNWIDVETTGVEVEKHKLLQVSCFVTDLNLNLLDDEGYTRIIQYPSLQARFMRSVLADEVVQKMHDKTGLWDKLDTGTPLAEVDAGLADYLASYQPLNGGYLAGNSIYLDRAFINHNLPKAAGYIHYRSVDVTSIAILAEEWYNGLRFPKNKAHDATDDIKESLDELKFLRKTVFR